MADTVETIYSAKGNHNQFLEQVIANQKQMLSSLNKGKTGVDNLVKSTVQWGVALATVHKAYNIANRFISESIILTNEQIEADTRLITISKRVTGATDDQIKSLMDLADAYQEVTTIGDEATQMGQSQLASFNLSSESTEALTESLLNLGVAQHGADVNGEQLIQTANLLGKAYSGLPSTLSRVGVLLNDQQKEMLRTGDEAQRVSTLINVVEQNYGGLAKAIADTPQGRITQLENEFSDLREEIGESFLPVVFEAKRIQLELADAFFNSSSDVDVFSDALVKTLRGLNIVARGGLLAAESVNMFVAGMTNLVAKIPGVSEEFKVFAQAYEEASFQGMQAQLDGLLRSWDEFDDTIDRSIRRVSDAGGIAPPDFGGINGDDKALEDEQKKYEELVKAREQAFKEIRLFAIAEDQREIARVNDHFRELLALFEDAGEQATDIRELITEEWTLQLEKLEPAQQTALEKYQEFWNQYGAIADMGISTINSAFSTMSSKRMSEIDEEMRARIEAVEATSKSEKRKQQEIEKIEQEARKLKHDQALADWRRSIAMIQVDTAAGIAKTWATVGYPAAIPLTIAMGAQSTIQTGVALANKPRFRTGSVDASGQPRIIGQGLGTSGGIDSQLGLFSPGELIVPPQDAPAVRDFMRSGGLNTTQTVKIDAPITIQGNASEEALAQIPALIEEGVARAIENQQYTNLFNPNLI